MSASRNIKLVVEYDGTCYHGWQFQKDVATIQAQLQNSISELTGEQITIWGSGRTDAGVHARAQVCNFKTSSKIPGEAMAKAINAHLPNDIVIVESSDVDMEFHSQFSAKRKAYAYHIANRNTRPAIEYNYCHWVWHPLDVTLMREAAKYLQGTHDFSSFEAANSPRKSSVRTVNYIDIQKQSCYIKILIEANGFLYKMVRNIVGTLIAVGHRKYQPQDVERILQARQRKYAAATVPARGLFLEYVKY